MNEPFQSWTTYWGLLHEDHDERLPSRVYGFENLASGTVGAASVPEDGACFGFVSAGKVCLLDKKRDSVLLGPGQWFSTPNGCELTIMSSHSAVFVAQRLGYRGAFTVGGPIEEKGRLRYIDGCSDSLLCCPPVVGDPCLNHLHFPGGIDQSEHTHPSLRAGIVAGGEGWCVTPGGTTKLTRHLIFVIPTDGLHRFRTDPGQSMTVIPYHPDSDWGPTHEEHPMVNRTLVAGKKIDNSQGKHLEAELAGSRVAPMKILKKKTIDRNVYELGLERVRCAYDRYDHLAVSFSGGKDSTACLHLALEVAKERNRLPLDVVFFDEEAIHPETIEYMRRVAQRDDVRLRWYCLPVKHRNACSRKSPYWHPWAPEDREKWCRELPPEAITELAGFNRQSIPEINGLVFSRSMGTVGMILGLRAGESLRRYRAVAHRTTDNYISQDAFASHVFLVKPIYDWTTADVWTAPKLFGWDYNRTYDVFQKAGVTRHDQRVCPPYGEEPLRGLYQYAVCWPELWEKMVERVPGANTARRYSRTPLYAFTDLAGWDPSADPKELIERALASWPPDTRDTITRRINVEIRNHHRKSREPIPLEQPGETGVTWKYLYQLAVRGDLKGRRTPQYAKDEATRY